MIHWLYNHVPAFRKAVNQIKFSQQKTEPNVDVAFVDPNGETFYRYSDDLKMPLGRKGVLNYFVTLMTAAVSEKELQHFVAIMRANLQKCLDKGKLIVENFSEIGFLLGELDKRREMKIHPDIMWDIIAVVYPKEEELRCTDYDWKLHEEKVTQFRRWSREGAFDFFLLKGWQEYLPYSTTSPNDLKTYIKSMELELLSQSQMLGSLLTKHGLLSELKNLQSQ